MKNKDRFEGVQERSFDFGDTEIRVLDEEARIVELSFSSETPVTRWGDDEILSHKKEAVMLDRINSTGCVLFNHNRDMVVGKVLEAAIKNKRGVAKVQFDDDVQSNVIYNKVKNKTLRGVSVGYRIHSMEHKTTKDKDVLKHTYTATLWEPLEISVVSIPADITVGVGRSVNETAEKVRSLDLFNRKIKINENTLKISKEAM